MDTQERERRIAHRARAGRVAPLDASIEVLCDDGHPPRHLVEFGAWTIDDLCDAYRRIKIKCRCGRNVVMREETAFRLLEKAGQAGPHTHTTLSLSQLNAIL